MTLASIVCRYFSEWSFNSFAVAENFDAALSEESKSAKLTYAQAASIKPCSEDTGSKFRGRREPRTIIIETHVNEGRQQIFIEGLVLNPKIITCTLMEELLSSFDMNHHLLM